MSFISRRLSVGLAVLAVSSGCQDGEVLGIPESSGAYGLLERGLLAVYNGGVDRAAPAQPCLADARYRQFDFWLGDWNVTAANGQGGSTNRITAGLDGCLVSENWTAANGLRGRSINAYDADLRQWHQTWVDSNGNIITTTGTLGYCARRYISPEKPRAPGMVRSSNTTCPRPWRMASIAWRPLAASVIDTGQSDGSARSTCLRAMVESSHTTRGISDTGAPSETQ